MKTVFELRYESDSIGVFASEGKVLKAILTYVDYLKKNNGLNVLNMPEKVDRYSVIEISNGKCLYIVERELFLSMIEFKRYLGL